MIEGKEEGEFMQVHQDYRNHPYQPPRLTPDQQEKDFTLMTQKIVYQNEYMDSFEQFQERVTTQRRLL